MRHISIAFQPEDQYHVQKINLQLIQLLKSVIVRDDLTLTITLFYVTGSSGQCGMTG